mmetsp:Transcript_55733/g.136536  ORF Transcript_55733/g.136536 Transcript_55733/m.136536 type:complete len:113 (+) Transcript_55733:3-341(+)
MQRWVVVGDALNEKKPAYRIAQKLRASGKDVAVVNPRENRGRCEVSLLALEGPVDVVDLVISPSLGPSIIAEMKGLGIQNVFIQPGACSQEVLELCAEAGISVHQGCVLVEL